MPYIVKELLFVAGAVLLAVLFLYDSLSLANSAAKFPRLVAGYIILLAGIMGLQAVRRHKSGGESAPSGREPVKIQRICLFLCLLLAYVSLVEPLGFFVATPLYIACAFWYLRATNPITAIAIVLGLSLLIYCVFVEFLHLPVPMGFLEE
jgi:hypothetical protein